jgi:putative hydrolase of the HAD superfamily
MYGVILKETGDGFVPYIHQTFPELSPEMIYGVWDKADVGELPSVEVFRQLGFAGDVAKIEREYLDTLEINRSFFDFAARAKRNHKLALISNDSIEWSKYLRDKFGLDAYFDAISVSGDLRMKKPDPRIFAHTIKNLACSPADCTYVDDRRYNVAAAQSLGMQAVLFNSRNVEYEGRSVRSFEELSQYFLKGDALEKTV